jgi:hypothetical protein
VLADLGRADGWNDATRGRPRGGETPASPSVAELCVGLVGADGLEESSHLLASGSKTAAQSQMQEQAPLRASRLGAFQLTSAEDREITDRLLTIDWEAVRPANDPHDRRRARFRAGAGVDHADHIAAELERHQPPPGRGRDCWFVAHGAAMARLLLRELLG